MGDPLDECVQLNTSLPQVMEQEIVVKPGDSDIVRLSILPLNPGLLRITGLEWVLNGQAQGRRLFAAKTPQHRRTGSRYTVTGGASSLPFHGHDCTSLTLLV